MMKSRLLTCLAVAAMASPALAQDNNAAWGPNSGDWEFSLGGGGTNDKEFETGNFNLDGELGYYLTDDLAVALRQSATYVDLNSGDTWAASSRVALDLYASLIDNRVRPFIGANVGYIYGEDVNDTWAAGPEAGVKRYVKDDTFIYGRAEYQFLFEDADDASDNFDDGVWLYTVGIGFNF
jgi:outer membrane protein W